MFKTTKTHEFSFNVNENLILNLCVCVCMSICADFKRVKYLPTMIFYPKSCPKIWCFWCAFIERKTTMNSLKSVVWILYEKLRQSEYRIAWPFRSQYSVNMSISKVICMSIPLRSEDITWLSFVFSSLAWLYSISFHFISFILFHFIFIVLCLIVCIFCFLFFL